MIEVFVLTSRTMFNKILMEWRIFVAFYSFRNACGLVSVHLCYFAGVYYYV